MNELKPFLSFLIWAFPAFYKSARVVYENKTITVWKHRETWYKGPENAKAVDLTNVEPKSKTVNLDVKTEVVKEFWKFVAVFEAQQTIPHPIYDVVWMSKLDGNTVTITYWSLPE